MTKAGWPERAVHLDLNMLMGTQQGKLSMPSSRFRKATHLYAAIVNELDLGVSTDVVRDDLLGHMLKAIFNTYGDTSAEMRSSRDLLGFTELTDDEIGDLANSAPAGWFRKGVPSARYQSKVFRLYMAALHYSPVVSEGAARGYQDERWVPAVANAIRAYLDDHRAEALAIAATLGITSTQAPAQVIVNPGPPPRSRPSPPNTGTSRRRPQKKKVGPRPAQRPPSTGESDQSTKPKPRRKTSRGEIFCVLTYIALFVSIPISAVLMPRPIGDFFYFIDENALVGNAAIMSVLAVGVGLICGVITPALFFESMKISIGQRLALIAVLVLVVPAVPLGHISLRASAYDEDQKLATSIQSNLTFWNPVLLDEDSFTNYQKACAAPGDTSSDDTFSRVYNLTDTVPPPVSVGGLGEVELGGYSGEEETGQKKVYVTSDLRVSTEAYQCDQRDGNLRTKLSAKYGDRMVMYEPGNELSVGDKDYYFETEVRPVDGGRLSSCVLAANRSGSSSGTTVLSVVNVNRNGFATYVAKVFSAVKSESADTGSETSVQISEPLPFVRRYSLFGDYDDWTKLAVYRKDGKISYLVNDREVLSTPNSNDASTFPALATRAGAGTTGGVAGCEFRYIHAYSRA